MFLPLLKISAIEEPHFRLANFQPSFVGLFEKEILDGWWQEIWAKVMAIFRWRRIAIRSRQRLNEFRWNLGQRKMVHHPPDFLSFSWKTKLFSVINWGSCKPRKSLSLKKLLSTFLLYKIHEQFPSQKNWLQRKALCQPGQKVLVNLNYATFRAATTVFKLSKTSELKLN